MRRRRAEDLVDIQLRDYRDITGTYDAIVSIEMLEAVGAEYFSTFFEVCDAALVPGRPAQPPVHHVPRCRLRPTAPRRELDPDVHLPRRPVPVAGRHRARDARHAACSSRRSPTSPTDYVRTLREWRTRFMEQAGVVRSMGFDDRFIRMWEYYLALSEAGFATGVCQDLQLVLEKRRGLEPV